ncbi:hypothetical protein ACTXML_15970 [Glutamicibacter arilaitensis]|uniref:hypothetical protein n=1 Tax=Glutamicibacter arilaitensis TaxID=256701 RepID=UPI003FD64308
MKLSEEDIESLAVAVDFVLSELPADLYFANGLIRSEALCNAGKHLVIGSCCGYVVLVVRRLKHGPAVSSISGQWVAQDRIVAHLSP